MSKLEDIAFHFALQGTVSKIEPLGNGLINDSYRLTTRESSAPDYVLQRINTAVFSNVEMLQNNIETVTDHIRRKLLARGETDINRKVLRFLPSDSGKTYHLDGADAWRIMLYVADSRTFETVTSDHAHKAGMAFGDFEAMLSDIPDAIGETIPHFHDMELRLHQLREAIKKDPLRRASGVRRLTDAILQRADQMTIAERLHREGKLPKRVCHCDTKVNNVLFDTNGDVLCVIDLDTVMPSFVFSDFGDFLRTAANTGKEDDKNLENVGFDMGIFRAFASGYIQSARQFLLPIETKLLPWSATLFPYMQSVRFLADYIDGDHYYKTLYPSHNLTRARAQFRLYEEAMKHESEMKETIEQILAKLEKSTK